MKTRHIFAVSYLLVGFLFCTGCGEKETKSTSAPSPGPSMGPRQGGPGAPGGAGGPASGNATYDQNCKNCHSLSDTPPTPGAKGPGGPNLAKIGANPEKNAEWIAAHIKNPKSHNPGSRMPGFEGKISEDEIKKLAEFLAEKK